LEYSQNCILQNPTSQTFEEHRLEILRKMNESEDPDHAKSIVRNLLAEELIYDPILFFPLL